MSACVVHPGWRDKDGYVRTKLRGRRGYAHRLAYEEAFGPIPDGMLVCHRCDNPPCVNTDHLFLGSNDDNLRDMTRKGRRVRGSSHGMSRLTEDDVTRIRAMRRRGLKLDEVAEVFGVSITTVSRAARGATWAHVR